MVHIKDFKEEYVEYILMIKEGVSKVEDSCHTISLSPLTFCQRYIT